ncbi:signal peptidase I [Frondihabitans sucicola]|uniref:Signal peptidase I n=1 Tax=Frondihabitans sucicola TaxID=1268041 RepID=A0ABN6XXK3_9MICO|nr:signal peptidase I [Frondihabitans sucicola]BDZ49762.1 signal peptidase I [Frondihabitans sucicola]
MTEQGEIAATNAAGAPRKAQRPWRFVRDIVIILLAALLISFLVKTFVARSFYIPSASMTNTLQINDRIIVNELVPKVAPVKRGDVIVFTDPGGWLQGGELADGDHLVKRVIGLPGDKVACCDASSQTEVNGAPLTEPYVRAPENALETKNADQSFSVTVPAGSVWVEGDNRGNSSDSRFHQSLPGGGFVPMSDIDGKAFVITWPISRWTWLGDYPDVFRAAAAAPSSR